MQPPRFLLRRRAPPPAAVPPLPPSSPPPPPLHQPPCSLPLPSALVPPKKRRVLQPPPRAAIPIPPPPPPPPPPAHPPADDLAPLHAGSSPPDDAGPSKPPPPPPVASVHEPYTPPPPPPPAADEKPATPPAADEAARPAPARKVRRVVKRVKTRKIVPKGTIAARKAAALAADGALPAPPPERRAANQSPGDQNAAPDEVAAKKPAACGNAVAKVETVGEGTLAGDTAEDCDVPKVEKKLVSKDDGIKEVGVSGRRRRMETEVFVGGLHRDAKEEDVREVLGKAGEITEVRLMMDAEKKKNKCYCFVRYREPAQAKKAITQFGNVKICGRICRVAALDGNDQIYLGNIDKKWKEEDVMKLLQKAGIENIDVVRLMADCSKPGFNRGFAFLDFETNRDAHIAYKKLSREDAFGEGLNIRVAWAEPLTDPDEKVMRKVKTIFVEGTPVSWDHTKMTEIFKKYGKIERVALSRDMPSAKRNDFAFIHYTTREAAMLCLESFDPEELMEEGSKVDIKVSLARPVQKSKQNKDHNTNIFQALGDSSYREGCNSLPRHENGSTYGLSTASYGAHPHVFSGYAPLYQYHYGNSRGLPGSNFRLTEPSSCVKPRGR
ncbi:hypothetical protein ACP4OV_011675 [Aristida adscensionis]